jgi:hypothetical protein
VTYILAFWEKYEQGEDERGVNAKKRKNDKRYKENRT